MQGKLEIQQNKMFNTFAIEVKKFKWYILYGCYLCVIWISIFNYYNICSSETVPGSGNNAIADKHEIYKTN